MEGKGIGFGVVVLVWGGLFYLFSISTSAPAVVSFGNGNFFAQAASSFNGAFGTAGSSQPFGAMDENGNFQKSNFHFGGSVNISQIEVLPSDNSLLFAASDNGIFASKDGGKNWYPFSDVEKKLNSSTAVYKILFNPAKKGESFISIFSAGKGTVYKSEKNFMTLEKVVDFDAEAAYGMEIKGNNLYLGLSNGKLLIYSLSTGGSRILSTFSSPITGLRFSPSGNPLYMTLKSGGIYASYNNGESFSRLKYLDNYSGANKVNDLLVLSSGNLYAATDYGLIRSFDNGATWKVFKGMPLDVAKISAVTVNSDGKIFAASNGKIYKSADTGKNWQIIETGLGTQISVMLFDGNNIIIGNK